jgi:hypothetical protein
MCIISHLMCTPYSPYASHSRSIILSTPLPLCFLARCPTRRPVSARLCSGRFPTRATFSWLCTGRSLIFLRLSKGPPSEAVRSCLACIGGFMPPSRPICQRSVSKFAAKSSYSRTSGPLSRNSNHSRIYAKDGGGESQIP